MNLSYYECKLKNSNIYSGTHDLIAYAIFFDWTHMIIIILQGNM